jgi:hypothetical protein
MKRKFQTTRSTFAAKSTKWCSGPYCGYKPRHSGKHPYTQGMSHEVIRKSALNARAAVVG